MNQVQIVDVLENVNLIKKVYDVTGERALVIYKEMLKADYDEYVGLKGGDVKLISEDGAEVSVSGGKVQAILDSTFETGKNLIGGAIGCLHEGEKVLPENAVKEYSKVIDELNNFVKDFREKVDTKLDEIDGLEVKENVDSEGKTVHIRIDIDCEKFNGSKLANNLINSIRQRGGRI